MKRFLFTFCVALLSTTWLAAGPLSQDELDRAKSALEKTREGVLSATKGLSDAQWNFKPAPTRWSIAEVCEHIAAAEDFLFGLVQDQVMKAPPRDEAVDVKEIDEFVLNAISDRSSKVKAPEPLMPTKRFGTPAGSVEHFKESRARTLAFLAETKDLRDHAIDSPLGKKLDAYQWLLFISAHSDRHTKQINEVKADAGFPKA